MLLTINIQKRGSEYFFEVFGVTGGFGTQEFGPFNDLPAAEAAAAAKKSELDTANPDLQITINTIA